MRTKYFWKFLLMMLSVSLTSSAADKNENRQVMERLIKLADEPVKYLPKMVATDDDAYEYCESMLSSGSDGMGLFSGSEELVGYLRQILTEAATQ